MTCQDCVWSLKFRLSFREFMNKNSGSTQARIIDLELKPRGWAAHYFILSSSGYYSYKLLGMVKRLLPQYPTLSKNYAFSFAQCIEWELRIPHLIMHWHRAARAKANAVGRRKGNENKKERIVVVMMLLLLITFPVSVSPRRINAAILQLLCWWHISITTLHHPTPTSLNYSRYLNRKLCSVASTIQETKS